MKKIVSLLLVALFAFTAICFTGCGAINDAEVSILWSGNGEVKTPNSLINSIERAMYIESIEYKHYGANGNVEMQVAQVNEALNNGACVLAVEPVSESVVGEIVDAAKAKDVPVVFFNCVVDNSMISAYDKCFVVSSNRDSISTVQGELIADYIKSEFKKLDKNEDGKISYVAYGEGVISSATVESVNKLLATSDYIVKTNSKENINTSIVFYKEGDVDPFISPEFIEDLDEKVELIITENDVVAFDVLLALQKKDYNTNKLTTHFVPVFTIGDTVDYKAYVIEGRPAIPANLVITDSDDDKAVKNKDKEIKKLEDLKAYYEENKFLVDLTIVDESDLDEMIYTTVNVIDSGRLSGTVTEDADALSIAVATIIKNLVEGNETFDGVADKVKEGEAPRVTVDGVYVKVGYSSYAN